MFDAEGNFYRDAIILANEDPENVETIFHPIYPEKNTRVKGLQTEPLLTQVVKDGHILVDKKTPGEIHNYLSNRSFLLPDEHKRFISPHIYKAGISKILMDSRNTLVERLKPINKI